jgi:hypothetical protein
VPPDHLAAVERLVGDLESAGLEPVLVGGMAMVVLGSRRVTRDFDFLISTPVRIEELVEILYANDFELVTKLDDGGEVRRTIDRSKVAAARLAGTRPQTLFFHRKATGLRVDLLLDHPLPAHSLAARADPVRFSSRKVNVARPQDLLRLKELARAERNSASDAEDIEYLKRLLAPK